MSGKKLSGALFKNSKKKTPKHPDYIGVVNISREFARGLAEKFRDSKDDEIKVQLSGWWKEPKDTKKADYISLAGDFGVESSGGSGERGRERDDRGSRGRDDRDRGRDDRDRGRDDGRRTPDFDDEIPF